VDERLAACGQSVQQVRSVHRWGGAVRHGAQARIALHTRQALVPEIVAVTDDLHPYDVPCVVATPFVDGNPEYLRWIEDETREPPSFGFDLTTSSTPRFAVVSPRGRRNRRFLAFREFCCIPA
jgi:periplasmic divalent cation tolerance protein